MIAQSNLYYKDLNRKKEWSTLYSWKILWPLLMYVVLITGQEMPCVKVGTTESVAMVPGRPRRPRVVPLVSALRTVDMGRLEMLNTERIVI